MQEFESQFNQTQLRQDVIKGVQEASECWPEIIAMWSGMVEQAKQAGWTEYAARSIVLSQIVRDGTFVLAVVPGAIPDEETPN